MEFLKRVQSFFSSPLSHAPKFSGHNLEIHHSWRLLVLAIDILLNCLVIKGV